MYGNALKFLALVLTALLLAPSIAHLASLPNKIAMSQENYLVAQQVYRGWNLFGVVMVGALAATACLTLHLRHTGAPFRFAFGAFLCIVAWAGVFFTWTYPANVATQSWTIMPAHWAALREQWEYAHAADAALAFAAFCLATLAALAAPRAST